MIDELNIPDNEKINMLRPVIIGLAKDIYTNPNDSELIYRLSQNDEFCITLYNTLLTTNAVENIDPRPIAGALNYAVNLYHQGTDIDETIQQTILNLALMEAVPESLSSLDSSEFVIPDGNFSINSMVDIIRSSVFTLASLEGVPVLLSNTLQDFAKDDYNCLLFDAALKTNPQRLQEILLSLFTAIDLDDTTVSSAELVQQLRSALISIVNS